MSIFGKQKKLADYNPHLTREDLQRRSRILVIDDERPGLITDLSNACFAVDHDSNGDDTTKIEKNLYDLILLDFGGVGLKWGDDEGLSLLRHIKRVNPAPFVLAYTSKNLTPPQSEFYRLTDGTLYKDAGIQESLEKIEDSLRIALDVERLWRATLKLALEKNTPDPELEKILLKSLRKKSPDSILAAVSAQTGQTIKDQLPGILLKKLVDLAVMAALA
jgi:DNA-binding NarL/FixJ family response regulator